MQPLEPKPLFKERIEILLPDSSDREAFWEIIRKQPVNSIRCNTIKIPAEKLKKQLEKKWKIKQPFKSHPETSDFSKNKKSDSHQETGFPEVMIIESQLLPGELGKSIEHLLGYYYVQEISSMLPMFALLPQPGELFLDLAAAPGSKTTQAAALMENQGTIIANDPNLGRIAVLSANLQKVGASNTIITRHDGVILCNKLKNLGMKFDKILVDAPCSGEGNLRSNPKTFIMWNIKTINKLSRIQKKLASSALEILKSGGEMIYSTCTHAPEENEEVIQYLLDNFNIQIETISLPLKTRPGLTSWQDSKFSNELKKACRVYPQDNNTEGFFLCKIKKK